MAKFFCEILTESLKFYEKKTEEIPGALKTPQEDINIELLKCLHKCEKSSNFWQNFNLGHFEPGQTKKIDKLSEELKKAVLDQKSDDEDDDDDFEPIETLDAPVKCDVAYLRDFIETLSEDKPYTEKLANFAALPNIVKHQIKHEHPKVGAELLNLLVYWENDFDSTEMEMLRKRSLCNTLSSKMEGNVQILSSLFPKEPTRVPQQILIIDVLSTAASEANLANLQILCKAAFENMLQIDFFETRDVPVRVPSILFFHRLLSTMPVQMIRSDMVNSYLKALSYMTKVDKATEQAVAYSMHNLMDRFRDIQFSNDEAKNDDLSAGLTEMRSWMWNLQDQGLTSGLQNMTDTG